VFQLQETINDSTLLFVGLQYHSAATKCLWYTASLLDQQQALSQWDSGVLTLIVTHNIIAST